MHWWYCINMQFYANTRFWLFVFNSVPQPWIVILIQGNQLRLSQTLRHCIRVYKHFSIKTSEEQLGYCSSIKNALALGGKQGNASYETDKTSELQVDIFELCFFFLTSLLQSSVHFLLFWETVTKSGGCTSRPKTCCVSVIDEQAVPSDVFHRMSYFFFFGEVSLMQMKSFVPKCENHRLSSVTVVNTKDLLDEK